MPSPGHMARNLRVDDVLAFDDAELVEYMKQNLHPDGGFDLEPEGWEKLPKDQREQLAERLRIGAQKVDDAVTSRPVDPDQLAARLNGIADNQDALPQALSRRSRYERTPTAELDWDTEARDETIAYNALVGDGCRPVYPISRLDEVFKGPEEYHEMLRPWKDFPGEWNQVFRTQLYRWKKFRRWQQDNREPDEEKEFAAHLEEQKRQDAEGTEYEPTASQYLEQLRDSYERRQRYYGHDDGEEGFAAYIEEKKQRNFQSGCQWPGMTEDEYMQMLRHQFKKKQAEEGIGDGDEGFAAFVKEKKQKDMEAGRRWPGMTEDEYRQMLRKEFNREQSRRYQTDFYWLREDHGRGGFSEYVAEAKRRLARHGFAKAFELDRDPTRQDKLTTWIEYLNYECSWLDKYTRVLAKLQPKYDKGWQKLMDSGVLRPGETAAGFCTMESAVRRQSERDVAKKAVDHAKQAGMEVLQKATDGPKSKSELPKALRIRMIQAKARIDAAEASLTEVMRRCDLISEFARGALGYEATGKNLALQNIRLQWVKEQVPLIEAEVREARVAEDGMGTRRKMKRRSGGDQDVEDAKNRSLKRRKQSRQACSPDDLSSSTRAKAPKHPRAARPRDEQPHGEIRGDRQSSNAQQVFNDVNTTSTATPQPTVTRTTRRRAGGAGRGLKTGGEPGHRQLRSSAVLSQAPTKQVRRSPRFATAQDKSGEGTKTASATAPPT